jgi:hypothetical protein
MHSRLQQAGRSTAWRLAALIPRALHPCCALQCDIEGAIKQHVFQLQPGQGGMSMAAGRASTRASMNGGAGGGRGLQLAHAGKGGAHDPAGSEDGSMASGMN